MLFRSHPLLVVLLAGCWRHWRMLPRRGYRRLAERCVAAGAYAQAAEYYRHEAAIYRNIGDANAAKVEEMKA